jgi:hypothetical protein
MSENETNKTVHVIFHNKKYHVAGLNWKAINSYRKKDIKSLCRLHDADYYVGQEIKEQDASNKRITLVGLINYEDECFYKRKIKTSYSLAINASELLNANSYGVFNLADDVYWFVAIVNGHLSVLSDIVGNKETISDAVANFLDFNTSPANGWVVYSPIGFFDDDSSIEKDWKDLVEKTAGIAKLRPVSNKAPMITWSLILLIFICTYLGWNKYQDYQVKLKMKEAREALLAENTRQAAAPLIAPWKEQPTVKDFLTTCSVEWKSVPISIAGWLFRDAECQSRWAENGETTRSDKIRFAYIKPDGGTVADFSVRLNMLYSFTPFYNIPGSADTGGFSKPLIFPERLRSEDVPSADYQTQRITTFAQQMRLGFNLQEDKITALPGSDGNLIDLPWRIYSFTYKSDIPPTFLFSKFDDTGIRFTKIKINLNNARLNYIIEGKLYANSTL